MNLGEMLAETVKKYPDKTAIALGDRRLSYTELDIASNKVAYTLLQMGLRQGDRVALLLTNTPEFAAIYFGIVKIGAIAVPLDTRYTVSQVTSLLANSQPRVLVADSSGIEPLIPVLSQFKTIERVIDASSKFTGQFLTYEEIMASGSAQPVTVAVKPEAPAHITYTSGSTGQPRGTVLPHRSLIGNAAAGTEAYGQTDKDVMIMFALPMYHAFGLSAILTSSVFKGSTVVIVPGLSIESLLQAIERERATIFMGVPYTFILAVNFAEQNGVNYDVSSLRVCVSGGSALFADTARRFKQYYHRDIAQIWGLTEGVAHVTTQPPDGSSKLCSVGKPLPGYKVKIVDDKGQELATNQLGEMITSGPMMDGYYANPEATAQTIKNGWLYTGDIGKIDEDGEVWILARKKELIIVKGQNVSPTDVEEVLYAHPQVAGAAVFGVHDELRGERIRAVVILKAGETATERELKQYCRQHLASFQVPTEIIIADALPGTGVGPIRQPDLVGE